MGYAWGSRTAIAELQGREPSAEPEAELWLGAHPKAPSRLEDGTNLRDFLAQHPGALGAKDKELPFLLKVLAAEVPLSLQAHPSLEQARHGYMMEEALGVPIDAVDRNYRDPNPKPELVCALTRFEALSGFRDRDDGLAVLRAFDVAIDADTTDWPAFLARTVRSWLQAPPTDAFDRLRAALPTARARYPREAHWTAQLLEQYPGDAGVLVALLLRHRTLEPGEALALEAGNLHAYLHGTAIEIMASSDNVLRGGLTPKHVDVDELLRVLRFDLPAPAPLLPHAIAPGLCSYPTPFEQFELTRYQGPAPTTLALHAGTIVLVTRGALRARSAAGELTLARGDAAFVAATEESLELQPLELQSSSEGVDAFLASVPRGSS